jgi:hypothetical protein
MMNNDKLIASMFFGAIGLTLGTVYFCPYAPAIHCAEWIDVSVLALFIIGYIVE